MVERRREGHGVYIWADGSRYEGDWLGDHMTGRGVKAVRRPETAAEVVLARAAMYVDPFRLLLLVHNPLPNLSNIYQIYLLNTGYTIAETRWRITCT